MRLTPEILSLVGEWSPAIEACDSVEPGAVRRFAQAIMDEDPQYGTDSPAHRFGGPIAPPLYPNHMLRRALGESDLIQERAGDPDFDGVVPGPGLAPLTPLLHLPVVNGGSEFELYRYARHGERVRVRQRYADIRETTTSKGALIVVVIESEMHTSDGELLMRSRRTLLRKVKGTA